VHKWRHHHLYQHGLSAAVSQGQKRALPMELKGFVTDADGVIVVIQIDQPNGIYLTHIELLSVCLFSDVKIFARASLPQRHSASGETAFEVFHPVYLSSTLRTR